VSERKGLFAGALSLLMTVGVICLCDFRKELTGAFYSSSDSYVKNEIRTNAVEGNHVNFSLRI
jgi:hypothetical protein